MDYDCQPYNDENNLVRFSTEEEAEYPQGCAKQWPKRSIGL